MPVTGRDGGVLFSGGRCVPVGRLSEEQARAVLADRLDGLSGAEVEALLAATGRWEVLLRLVNRCISARIRTGMAPGQAARQLLARIKTSGRAGADFESVCPEDESPGSEVLLDLDDPEARSGAVGACVQAATELLSPQGGERFAELGVFAGVR